MSPFKTGPNVRNTCLFNACRAINFKLFLCSDQKIYGLSQHLGVCPLALKCILRYLQLKISFMLLNCFLHLLYHSNCEFLWQFTLDTLLKFPNTHTQMQHTHSMPNAIWAGGRRLQAFIQRLTEWKCGESMEMLLTKHHFHFNPFFFLVLSMDTVELINSGMV